MKSQTLLSLVTAVNLGLLWYQVAQPHPGVAATTDAPAVIRGRALEIVDDRGRVRASLSVLPEDPKVTWKGKPYPETVLLRLMSPDGRPNVKLGASKVGSGLVIGGESNPTYIQLLADGGETTLKLVNKDGLERLIKPQGDGTFTRALAELLGPDSRIYAVDRAARAVAALKRWAAKQAADVTPVVADFTRPFDLPGLEEPRLDGILLANALHFVPDAAVVLRRLTAWLRPGGRVVLVEYDRRAASRWVPYPIPLARLAALTASAGLTSPVITATRPSAFGGILYVAAADRLAEEPPSG